MGKHNHEKEKKKIYELNGEYPEHRREKGVQIDIEINVTKILKYCCIATVFIIGTTFGLKAVIQLIALNYTEEDKHTNN